MIKTQCFARGALGGLLLFALATGCAQDRLNWSGTSARQHSGDAHRPSSVANRTVTQKLCPVTGEPLESMGGSIPVEANGETIYVCCQGCVRAVEKDPATYLAVVRNES